jgi:hypothetical protein
MSEQVAAPDVEEHAGSFRRCILVSIFLFATQVSTMLRVKNSRL